MQLLDLLAVQRRTIQINLGRLDDFNSATETHATGRLQHRIEQLSPSILGQQRLGLPARGEFPRRGQNRGGKIVDHIPRSHRGFRPKQRLLQHAQFVLLRQRPHRGHESAAGGVPIAGGQLAQFPAQPLGPGDLNHGLRALGENIVPGHAEILRQIARR